MFWVKTPATAGISFDVILSHGPVFACRYPELFLKGFIQVAFISKAQFGGYFRNGEVAVR